METLQSRRQLTQHALTAARTAAKVAMGGFRTRPNIELKGARDLVTEFDLASEKQVRKTLSELTPEIPILGEELGGNIEADADELRWAVDPIDGTTNFAHGHPVWGVSVGLVKGRKPILGAVVAPVLQCEWWGFAGTTPLPGAEATTKTVQFAGEAFRNGTPCQVSQTDQLESALVATGFPTDRAMAPRNNFDSFIRVMQFAQAGRRCGACCIDLCFVADGTYDAYWERPLHLWDAAAGAAILLGAGGKLTALDGSEADLTQGNLIASNGRVHEQLIGPINGRA